MTICLAGIGLATPELFYTQAETLARSLERAHTDAKQQRLAPRLYDMSGVKQRYSAVLERDVSSGATTQSFFNPPCDTRPLGPTTGERMLAYNQHAPAIAARAARGALAAADLDPSSITHLVTVSCSGFAAPGVDVALIRDLALPATTARTHVGFMGCHGALNGLRVARALATQPDTNVLMVAVELCSLHYQYEWTPQRMVANSLFADGAAAAVVKQEQGGAGVELVSHHAQIMPSSEDAMSWHIGDHGFDMTLAATVPELIAQHLRPSLETWLTNHQLSVADVTHWAIHPGGPRILDASAAALGLTEADIAASRQVLAQHGNMSSPTVLFVLDQVLRQGKPGPLVALGFGPGLALEAALLLVD